MNGSTFIQVDLQNLFFAARNHGQKIDFEKIWEHFNSRENEFLNEALVYMIRSQDFDSSKFEAKLKSIGYSLRIKQAFKLQNKNRTIYKQTNQDVLITIDCMDKINSFDKWVLMSGDGDFADLCSYLKKRHKQIEIWSFKECYNHNLEMYADKIHFIEDNFFYKKPVVNVFGFNWGSIK